MKTSYSMTSAVKVKTSLKTFIMPLFMTAACLFLVACQENKVVTVLQGKTMGTYWQVSIAQSLTEAEKNQLEQRIEADLQKVNQQMSTYIADSELEQFNHSPIVNQPIPISAELRHVISAAQTISKQSEGYYDITVGPLVNLWGFGPQKVTTAPSEAEIMAAKARVGYQQLTLNEAGLSKARQDIALDLSSIAKGYGVDVVAEEVSKSGYANYIVDIGGEVRAGGDKYGAPWKIGIQIPQIDKTGVERVISLKDQKIAMATSGNYLNYADYGKVHAAHEINPKTGMPELSTLLSVTVVAEDCMLADGYATAFMAMGDKRAPDFAKKFNLAALFIYAGDNANTFRVETSPAWQQHFGGAQ